MKSNQKYVVLTDVDDPRLGEVRLGGYRGDDGWEGGQLIFKWEQHVIPSNSCAPARVTKIVGLANKALKGSL